MNWLQSHSWFPNQQEHATLQKTYLNKRLNFKPDWAALFEHNTLRQCQLRIPNLLWIGGGGVVVGEFDVVPTNEEKITLCVVQRTSNESSVAQFSFSAVNLFASVFDCSWFVVYLFAIYFCSYHQEQQRLISMLTFPEDSFSASFWPTLSFSRSWFHWTYFQKESPFFMQAAEVLAPPQRSSSQSATRKSKSPETKHPLFHRTSTLQRSQAPCKTECLLESLLLYSSRSSNFRNQRSWGHLTSSSHFQAWCPCGRFSYREGKPVLPRSAWWSFCIHLHWVFRLWLTFSDRHQDSTQERWQGMFHFHNFHRWNIFVVLRCWGGLKQSKFWLITGRVRWFPWSPRYFWGHNVWYLPTRPDTHCQNCLCPTF